MKDDQQKMLDAANAAADGNWKLALRLFQELAALGYADAEHTLGWFHEQGVEVPKSNKEAFKWWAKAAAKGIKESQSAIAAMYQHGEGVDIDLEKAFYWFSIASRNGSTASFFAARDLEKELTEDQVKQLTKKIKEDFNLLKLN